MMAHTTFYHRWKWTELHCISRTDCKQLTYTDKTGYRCITVTVNKQQTYDKIPNLQLQPTDVQLKTYTEEVLQILREAVMVNYGKQTQQLVVCAVKLLIDHNCLAVKLLIDHNCLAVKLLIDHNCLAVKLLIDHNCLAVKLLIDHNCLAVKLLIDHN